MLPQRLAFVFPGQGSQFVGMGKDLAEHSPSTKKHFNEANGTLGFKLTDVMFEGPENTLRATA